MKLLKKFMPTPVITIPGFTKKFVEHKAKANTCTIPLAISKIYQISPNTADICDITSW